MSATMTFGLRRILVAALLVALTLAGLGRAFATAIPLMDPQDPLPGVHVPICRSGSGEAPADPARPVPHDCCDDCALLAPVVLPSPAVVTGPAPVARHADHGRPAARAPRFARLRHPRLSRGPPAV